jgi:chromosome segregation ATPase
MTPVELKRRVQDVEATLKEQDRALKKHHEDCVRGDARARLLEGQLRDSDKHLKECNARLNESGSWPEVRELEETLQEPNTLLKERRPVCRSLMSSLKNGIRGLRSWNLVLRGCILGFRTRQREEVLRSLRHVFVNGMHVLRNLKPGLNSGMERGGAR